MSKQRTAEEEDNQLIVGITMAVAIVVITGAVVLFAAWR